MMKLSSAPQAIIKAFRMCVMRFPAPSLFVTSLSAFLIFCLIDEGQSLSDKAIGVTSYFLSIAFLLSLTIQLWAEEGVSKRTATIVFIVSHAILLADSIYLHYALDARQTNYELLIAHAATTFALLLSIFFLSFLKEKDNIASWNFAMNLIANGVICLVVGLIMWGGTSILLVSLQVLFDIDFDGKWYGVLGVLTTLLLSSWLLIGRIPEGERKYDRKPLDSNFLNAVIRFLFLPLVGLYIIVLYIYAARILVRWELPSGGVSLLVVTSMIGLIIIEFGLYPIRKLSKKNADHFIARYLPLAILPLLLLMTIGIIRRFNDYGITINRLYIITLNIWFYFVCIVLFITKAKRINWITISFAIIFLLTSSFPINYTSITRNYLHSSISHRLEGKKLPLNIEQYENMIHTLPKEKAITLNEQLLYLQEAFGSDASKQYVKDKNNYVSFYSYKFELEEDTVMVEEIGTYYRSENDFFIDFPEDYNRYIRCSFQSIEIQKNQKMVKLVPTENDLVTDTFLISTDTLKAYGNKADGSIMPPIMFHSKSGKNLFYATYFDMSSTQLDIDGFVLQKK